METIFKVFTGVFVLMMLTAGGIGLIGATLNANAADHFYSDASKRISVSHFSKDVIEECEKEAKEKGYVLDVKTYQVSDTKKQYGSGKLTYDFSIPVLE